MNSSLFAIFPTNDPSRSDDITILIYKDRRVKFRFTMCRAALCVPYSLWVVLGHGRGVAHPVGNKVGVVDTRAFTRAHAHAGVGLSHARVHTVIARACTQNEDSIRYKCL